jgi:hypothetical protein
MTRKASSMGEGVIITRSAPPLAARSTIFPSFFFFFFLENTG